eukprot:scaffold57_cov202-Prasinococcus_capsulatus_cf.AAC.1
MGYSDSDYAGDASSRKSLSGYVFMFCGASIVAGCKQQDIVAQSTCESEFVGLGVCAKEALYLRQFFTEINSWDAAKPVIILGDNSCANALTVDPVFHAKTKHIDIRYKMVKDEVAKGRVGIAKVDTKYNLADLFTKPLGRDRFKCLRRQILGMPDDSETPLWVFIEDV